MSSAEERRELIRRAKKANDEIRAQLEAIEKARQRRVKAQREKRDSK